MCFKYPNNEATKNPKTFTNSNFHDRLLIAILASARFGYDNNDESLSLGLFGCNLHSRTKHCWRNYILYFVYGLAWYTIVTVIPVMDDGPKSCAPHLRDSFMLCVACSFNPTIDTNNLVSMNS